jgi:Flp pilus assembly protein TadB
MKTSRSYSLLFLIIAVAALAYLFWSHKRAEERERQEYAEQGRQLQAVVDTMSSRWNAVIDWQGGLEGVFPRRSTPPTSRRPL